MDDLMDDGWMEFTCEEFLLPARVVLTALSVGTMILVSQVLLEQQENYSECRREK